MEIKKTIFSPECFKSLFCYFLINRCTAIMFSGSALRYCIQLLMHERIVPYNFPWATFTVNIFGSFLIGLFYALSERFHLPFEVRLFLTTGLCGGFTTFSTFSSDGIGLLKGEFYGTFITYTLLSIAIGLTAVVAGGYLGKQL